MITVIIRKKTRCDSNLVNKITVMLLQLVDFFLLKHALTFVIVLINSVL